MYAKIADLLIEARQKITKPGTWITGAMHSLRRLCIGGKYEDTYCTVGVIQSVTADKELLNATFHLLCDNFPADFKAKYTGGRGGADTCMFYNDHLPSMLGTYERAHQAVLELFDAAIAAAKAKAEEEKPAVITQNEPVAIKMNVRERELVAR